MNELNEHGQWRLALAAALSQRIAACDGVSAIVVGGSVARGYADEYSDLEIPLFWSALPSDATRHALIAALDAELLYPYSGPALEDNLLIQGFQVDLWHNTVAHEEQVIEDVLTRYSTDLGASNFMDTLRVCIPLYGHAIIERWKQQAQRYPDQLAIRAIEVALTAIDVGQPALYARRDHPTLVYELISALQKQMFLILLALNHAYFPTFKWMYRVLESLPVQPLDTAQRFRSVFGRPLAAAISETIQLCNEVLDLVAQRYPSIDTGQMRQALLRSRPAQHTPVSL